VRNGKDSDFLYIKINGRISQDYYELIFPLFIQKAKKGGPLNLVLEMEDFDDTEFPFFLRKFGLNVDDFDKIAIVGDQKWEKWIEDLNDPDMAANILYFSSKNREKVQKWISINKTY
jgi:hypothetical protein